MTPSVLGLERQYTTLTANFLACLLAREGGSATVTRGEFEMLAASGEQVKFEATEGDVTMYLERPA